MSEPLVVDIGAAMKTLEANPDLATKMNELIFGKLIADQLAQREALIMQLGEALDLVLGNLEKSADLFEVGQNEEAWEWVSTAQISTKKALMEFRAYAGQETV
jgi:hypothetical protein